MIGKLGEVIVYVEDMGKQVVFYRDVLGFSVVEPSGQHDLGDAYWVRFDTGPCHLALHGGGRRRFGEDAPKFVFIVDDLPGMRATLIERGVPVGDIRTPAPGIAVADCRDPEGNAFSLESHP